MFHVSLWGLSLVKQSRLHGGQCCTLYRSKLQARVNGHTDPPKTAILSMAGHTHIRKFSQYWIILPWLWQKFIQPGLNTASIFLLTGICGPGFNS